MFVVFVVDLHGLFERANLQRFEKQLGLRKRRNTKSSHEFGFCSDPRGLFTHNDMIKRKFIGLPRGSFSNRVIKWDWELKCQR